MVHTHRFTFFQPKRSGKQRERSGNAAGSNEKQREATINSLQSISSDLQRLAGQRQKQGSAVVPTGGRTRAMTQACSANYSRKIVQPRKQHRLAGTRSFARTHARMKRIRFPSRSHPPTSVYILLFFPSTYVEGLIFSWP